MQQRVIVERKAAKETVANGDPTETPTRVRII